MKNTLAIILFVFPMVLGTACDQGENPITENIEAMSDTLIIKIGDKEFAATLLDNPSARAFKALLPLTISMTELNGNEKYVRLPNSLPTEESNPGTIKSGDLMLYGSTTLVLFYESFSTSYSYTKLGQIIDVSGLEAALGTGSINVNISLK